jgi:hypothetical protein
MYRPKEMKRILYTHDMRNPVVKDSFHFLNPVQQLDRAIITQLDY